MHQHQNVLSQLLKQLVLKSIAIKLAVVISILVCILISFLGFTLTHRSESVLKARVAASNEEIAKRSAREISLFVNRPVELLEIASQLLSKSQKDAWEEETVLVELSLRFPMFEEIISASASGTEIASSNPGRPKKNRFKSALFQQALKGKTRLSSIRVERDYLPHITIAVPYERSGRIAGVLMADTSLRGLWDIVDGIRFGRTGRAFLVSEKGLLIAHPDKKLVFRNVNFNTDSTLKPLLSGAVKTVQYRSADQKVYLASYAPVEGYLPLAVVTQLEKSEAYALLDQMRIVIWSVLLVSLFISVAVSFFVAGQLVRPIRRLTEWGKKISIGDFDYQTAPTSLDELGRLFLVFRRMSKRLKRARGKEHLAALGVAATTITHKLKNSIVSLKTYAELFPERKKDEVFIQKFERVFNASVHHLESMFKNLSQVSMQHKPDLESVDLAELFEKVHMAYTETLAQMNIQFALEFSKELPTIEGDREHLYELWVNLVQNAIQAMPQGGTLRIRAKPTDSFVEIAVEDTGIGIPEESLSQVFKPFFTTKHNGMGLGLAVAKKVAEDHHGAIQVASTPGKGSVFTVLLPTAARKKKISIEAPLENISS